MRNAECGMRSQKETKRRAAASIPKPESKLFVAFVTFCKAFCPDSKAGDSDSQKRRDSLGGTPTEATGTVRAPRSRVLPTASVEWEKMCHFQISHGEI
jgi:hypothetical protein